MTKEEKEKLIDDHWSYINRILIYYNIEIIERHYASLDYKRGFSDGLENKICDLDPGFHYFQAYEHGLKHRKEMP